MTPSPPPRPLETADYDLLRIPAALRGLRLAEVTPSAQPIVRGFIDRVDDAFARRVNLYLFGAPGRGKTGAAAVLLAGCRARFKTGLFVSYPDILLAARYRKEEAEVTATLRRAAEVELLVLDNLRSEELADRFFPPAALDALVRAREGAGRLTVVTTPLPPAKMRADHAPLGELLAAYVPVEVTGPDRRLAGAQKAVDFVRELRAGAAPLGPGSGSRQKP